MKLTQRVPIGFVSADCTASCQLCSVRCCSAWYFSDHACRYTSCTTVLIAVDAEPTVVHIHQLQLDAVPLAHRKREPSTRAAQVATNVAVDGVLAVLFAVVDPRPFDLAEM